MPYQRGRILDSPTALFHAGEASSGPRREVLNCQPLGRTYSVAAEISSNQAGAPMGLAVEEVSMITCQSPAAHANTLAEENL
jgi:hypothetical protein